MNERNLQIYAELTEFIGLLSSADTILEGTFYPMPHKYGREWREIRNQISYLMAKMQDEQKEAREGIERALGIEKPEIPF